jgi:hypothetical protein
VSTIYIDYAGSPAASMIVGGMSVAERVLREAATAGAEHAIVRADMLPPLPVLPIEIAVIPTFEPPPEGATTIPGDVVAGVRVTNEATRRAAQAALLQSCRRPYDGVGDRYVIRPISLRLTGVLAGLGVTPNQVTVANIVVGLTACVLAATAHFALAGVLMLLQVVLDSCDGELARIRYMHSRLGMWLDNGSDDVIDNLFVAMVGVGLGGVWMPIAIAAACARGAVAVMIYLELARVGRPGDVMSFAWWFDKPSEALTERYEDQTTSFLGIVRGLGRRDVYVLLWGACCVVGFPFGAFALGVGLCATYFGMGIGHVRARMR